MYVLVVQLREDKTDEDENSAHESFNPFICNITPVFFFLFVFFNFALADVFISVQPTTFSSRQRSVIRLLVHFSDLGGVNT